MRLFQIQEIFTLQSTLIKQYGCFKLVHFAKTSGWLSSAGPEIQAFVSHSSANFQLTLDCFMPNFKLQYEDSENVKADRVNTVVFNLHQIKHLGFFLGHPVCLQDIIRTRLLESILGRVNISILKRTLIC